MTRRTGRTRIIAGVVAVMFICAAAGYSYAGPIKDSVSWYDKGKGLYKKGDFEGAVKCFHKAVYGYPKNVMTEVSMYFLANTYWHMGDAGRAVSVYQNIITRYGKSYWVDLAKGDLKEIQSKK